MALLHMLADWQRQSGHTLSVVTVDHGLRRESADEARFVAQVCRSLRLPHTILRWQRDAATPASANAARGARHALLHAHAVATGAACIALGHTCDDQAETVTMRARRMGPRSGTGGLAGMSVSTALTIAQRSITLYRPLLHLSRADLRHYLVHLGQGWCDDPTNDDPSYERVRVRRSLSATSVHTSVADSAERARFAAACGKLRLWLAQQIAAYLVNHATRQSASIRFDTASEPCERVLAGATAACLRHVGHNAFALPERKLAPVLTAVRSGTPTRHAVGRCLLTVTETGLLIEPEHRPGRVVTPPAAYYTPAFDAPVHKVLDRLWPVCGAQVCINR